MHRAPWLSANSPVIPSTSNQLFIPPVESDVPPKPSAKVDPSHARSPIRRADRERRRHLQEAREQRIRMLAALQAREHNTPHGRNTIPPSSTIRSIARPLEIHRVPGRQSPRLENPRISELNQHLELERRYFSQAMNGELSRDLAADDLDDELNPIEAQLALGPVYREPVDLQHAIFRYRPVRYSTSGLPGRSTIFRREIDHENDESRHRRRRHIEHLTQPVSVNPTAGPRHPQRVRYVDGLGDRDRSLSPGSDAGVWDTLQSTLTPDPQPPSVGSSFTSTAVSATTQVNGTDSVNTSMTTPNEETEPPCDPVLDNSASDGEDDIGAQPIVPSRDIIRYANAVIAERSRGFSRQSPESTDTRDPRRSYADVVAEPFSRQSPESADTNDPEWLSGMHRIVQNLAQRVDIPDEWWLQAGLSRSMSWEDSN
ncbi:hypothetical protein F5Y10DRAFT_85854 [Nemania abortiva]|nr:hypothetical protein F5Y10DRAFT_85854 [Nemania abortiva]